MDSDYINLGAPAAAWNPASQNQQQTTAPEPAGPCCVEGGQAEPTNSADVIQQPNFDRSAYVPSAPDASFEKQQPQEQASGKEEKGSVSNDKLAVPEGADPSVHDNDLFAIMRVGYGPLRLVHFGPFSRVYFVRHKKNPAHECMAKVEAHNEKKRTLGIEARVYLDCKGVCGFAELYDRFQTSDGSRVLVIQRLGTDLNRIRLSLPNQSLTQADALKLCLETFARIWSLHDRNWMHRDIKPSNFVVGLPQSKMDDQVFIIDFGLARQRQEKSRPTGACPILGTDAYRPISNYSRVEYQPKDDIESWFYMCHEFFNGALPWDKLPHSSTLDFKIHCRKLGRDLLLSNMPDTFDEILKSIDSSKTKVDYFQISTLLKAALANLSQEQLAEPFSWKKDPTIVHRAIEIEQPRIFPGI
uniref:Protein kinase domain-containing protein n=2 Tax=Meloidogyne TaxID=189290 RepID=A0A915N6H9_MELJA